MNKTFLSIVIAGLGCSLNLFAETGPRPIELFNGKDLAGWKSFLDDPKVKQEQEIGRAHV